MAYTSTSSTTADLVSGLPREQQLIVDLLYGLDGEEAFGPSAVARALGMSTAAVMALEAKAFREMRKPPVKQ